MIELVRGRLDTPQLIWLAGYPLLFFYILACLLSALNDRSIDQGSTFKLLALGTGLFLVDQVVKTWVSGTLPYGSSQPLLHSWLHLAHERNLAGSWILETLGLEGPDLALALVMFLVMPGLLLSGLVHRYYSHVFRLSFWADIAFCFLFAGMASFLVDMLLRGYILDYIGLPGLVAADLKDIYLTIGSSAMIVEVLDNPKILLEWRGWRAEWAALKKGARNLYEFGKADLRRLM